MFVLLPVILLLFSSLLILILQRNRQGFGYAWVISLGATLLTWVAILWLHWKAPAPLEFTEWVSFKDSTAILSFQMDSITWPYALSLVAVTLAVIITDISRLQGISSVWEWAGSLALTGAGLLAVMAGSPITLALTWMVLDLIDLIYVLRSVTTRSLTYQVVLSFAARAAGTFFVLLAAIVSRSQGVTLSITNIPAAASPYLFIAGGLRLGVFPIHPPYISISSLRRGFGTILRLVSPASSLMLLSHLPGNPIPASWTPLFLFLTVLVVLYAALMWFTSANELSGRPFWLLSLAGLAMVCILRGQPASSQSWGITLILSGALIFLFSARTPGLIFIPILGGLSLLGLPYSPSSGGWAGLVNPFGPVAIITIFAVFLLTIGYFYFANQPGDNFSVLERWAKPIYPLGLSVLIITHWVIGIWGFQGSLSPGTWWASVIPLLLSVAMLIGSKRAGRPEIDQQQAGFVQTISRVIWKPLSKFFYLGWFYRLLGTAYMVMDRLVNFFSTVLEGDGGVLWAFLFLALLVSVLRLGGTP